MVVETKHNRNSGKEILVGSVLSTIAGTILSGVGLLLSNYLPSSRSGHWSLWFFLGVCAYVCFCLAVDIRYSDSPRSKMVRSFTIPNWSSLKSFGSQPFARISYFVLILVPLLAFFSQPEIMGLPFNLLPLPLNLKLSYFASWFFAISLVFYATSCPKEIKKIDPVKNVRTLNVMLSNISDANVKIDNEVEDVDTVLDASNISARTICFLFYGLGTVAAVIVLFRSAISVLGA